VIEGVVLKPLVAHKDERGELFEILRRDDSLFRQFGQAYLTKCSPGWVKGWHFHTLQWDNFCCVRGAARIVLLDERKDSPTSGQWEEYDLGPGAGGTLAVLRIPPYVLHGIECLGTEECWILNNSTELYDHKNPDEFRKPLTDLSIPYEKWRGRKGW